MTDETRNDPQVKDTSGDEDIVMPPAAPKAPRRRWRKWTWIVLGVIVLVPVLVLTAWTAITLNWSYSKGTRTGYVQKFSKKGWVCKTWEGEIAMINVPGAMQERFAFTVRDDSIAALINRHQGQRVVIEYDQHLGIPSSCFGETQYFVKGVRALGP
jgi:ABC-type phosphate/phosphonate transport system permease subunit